RFRPIFGALAGASLVVAVALVLASGAPGDVDRLPKKDLAAAEAEAPSATVSPRVRALVPRGRPPLRSAGATVPAVALLPFLLRYGLVGRTRRRVGDVGDGWRSLLHGAPPVRS